MSSIRFLKTFIAVSEYGSFAAAADRVALTNAAVGQQMRALEEEMRRELFDRSHRQIRLSREGLLLLPKAKRLVADYEKMLADTSADAQMEGEVTIGGITSAMGLLANCLVKLKLVHPRVSVTLTTAKSDELTRLVISGELDAALIVEATRQNFSALSWTRLYEEPVVLLANASQTAGEDDVVQLLRTMPFIRYDKSTAIGRKVDRVFKSADIVPEQILELNSIIGIADLVKQKVGVTIVPLLRNYEWENDPALRVLSLPGDPEFRRIGMLEHGSKSMITSEIRSFLLKAIGR
ncbi:LysR family transcriptional regulator [Pigmentiphaga aceris]|uniref:LysR family transcriptional regulator n=1 Tax=Pigmentiphaga aceris TaxID=1940612 RepID=A0A5C0AVX1_9BURK|nr:LysR family transcriptional regulator [Pigmentiphaga aceris]QEI06592.1 LysR family transcriptional regulator [Pigmentiphaga aceris]